MINIKVIVAKEPSGELKERIESVFSNRLDSPVEAQYVVDANVIGGLIVVAGDKVYDGSISTELNKLKVSLE